MRRPGSPRSQAGGGASLLPRRAHRRLVGAGGRGGALRAGVHRAPGHRHDRSGQAAGEADLAIGDELAGRRGTAGGSCTSLPPSGLDQGRTISRSRARSAGPSTKSAPTRPSVGIGNWSAVHSRQSWWALGREAKDPLTQAIRDVARLPPGRPSPPGRTAEPLLTRRRAGKRTVGSFCRATTGELAGGAAEGQGVAQAVPHAQALLAGLVGAVPAGGVAGTA